MANNFFRASEKLKNFSREKYKNLGMCPYCRNFITKGLYDIYQQYDDFLNIELVPCGNAARGVSFSDICFVFVLTK